MSLYTKKNVVSSIVDAAVIGGTGISVCISDSGLYAVDYSRDEVAFRLF